LWYILNSERLKAFTKDQILTLSKTLTATDIRFLVETLNEKDDKLRYNAFLLLQAYSRLFSAVYEYKFNDTIKQRLANLQLSQYKENQQKLLSRDISKILKIINQ